MNCCLYQAWGHIQSKVFYTFKYLFMGLHYRLMSSIKKKILKLYVGLGLDIIPPTLMHLNYNGKTVRVFESCVNQI